MVPSVASQRGPKKDEPSRLLSWGFSPSLALRPLHMHWKDKDTRARGRTESTSRWESTLLEARTDIPLDLRTNGGGPGESALGDRAETQD